MKNNKYKRALIPGIAVIGAIGLGINGLTDNSLNEDNNYYNTKPTYYEKYTNTNNDTIIEEEPKDEVEEKEEIDNTKNTTNTYDSKKNTSNNNTKVDTNTSTNTPIENNTTTEKNEESTNNNVNESQMVENNVTTPPAESNTNVEPTIQEDTRLPLKAICKDGTVSYQDDPSKPNYRGMCSGHNGIEQKLGRVP